MKKYRVKTRKCNCGKQKNWYGGDIRNVNTNSKNKLLREMQEKICIVIISSIDK